MSYYLVVPDSDEYDNLKILAENALEMVNRLNGNKISASWQPVPVGRVHRKRRGDFPSMLGVVTFSERAWQTLKPLIGQSVEALPLLCKDELFYAINVFEKVSLDFERAEVKRLSDGVIIRVKKYAFKHEDITTKHIFTPKEVMYSKPIVSEAFKHIVEKNGLEGLIFKEI